MLAGSASAQVTWDANTTTSGPQDGSGTWSTSDANWWNGTTDVVWPNLTTSSAIIGASSGAAGTITTSGSLTLNAITFNAPGSGNYTLTGGTLGFAGSNPTITANAAATIGSAITSSGLSKAGTGTLTLSGIVSDAGTMKISRGAVTLTGTLTNSSIDIGSASGGILTIAGGTMSTSAASPRTLRIGPGPGQSGTMAISGGGLSTPGMYIGEDAGGNGVFTQSGGSVSIGSSQLYMAGNTSSLTVSGGSFTNNNITYFAAGGSTGSGISTSTISVSGSGSITLGTLRYGFDSRNGFTATLNVGDGAGGGTFQVNSISTGATSVASTINFNSGTFVANSTFLMPAQISTVVKAGGANISVASAQTLTLGRPLTDDGGGGVLRKLGSGTLSLTGANTYAGTTSIAAGSLSIGNALALQNSTLDLNASDTGTVSAINQNSTLGGLTGSRNLDMLTRTLSIGNNGASTAYSGTLSNGALKKIGSGTFTLTGANAYTGATTIDAGVLRIGDGGTTGSLSASSAISGSAGAELAFSRTDNYGGVVSNTIGGGIAVTHLGTGTVTLAGSNTFTGTTRLVAGGLTLGHASALQNSTLDMNSGDAGTLGFGLTGTNTYVVGGLIGSRDIATSGSVVLSVGGNGSSGSYTGALSGGGGFTKAGSGTLTLGGANTYTGTTTIGGGVLVADVANVAATSGALGNGGSIRFTGGTLQFTAASAGADYSSRIVSSTGAIAIDTNGQNVSFNTALASTNTGGLTKLGSGTLALVTGAAYTGTTAINGGTLKFVNNVDVAAVSSSTFLINNASTLHLVQGTRDRDTFLNSKTIVFDAAGGGTFLLDAGNHLSMLNNTTTFKTTGGARNFATGTNSGYINGQTAGIAAFDVAKGTDPTVDLVSTMSLSNINITKTGAGTLSIQRSTVGNFLITISQGTFEVGGSATLNAGNFSANIPNSGAFQYNSTVNQTISGTISGAGSLVQMGSGTLTLSGLNTYSGATTVSAGSLVAGGTAAFGAPSGTISVSGGVLDLGGYAFTRTGTVSFTGGTTQSGTITNNTVAFDAQAGTVSAVLAGSAGLTKTGAGRWVLSGSNAYSGQTTISAGVLALGANGSFANSSSIKVGDAGSSNAVLDLTAKTAAFALGAGQTLSGGGTVLVASGQQFQVQGTFAPGNSPGLFTFDGGTTVLSGTTVMEIFGTSRATSPSHGSGFYDAVNVVNSGVLQFGGNLTFEFSSLFDDDTTFDLFSPATGSSLAGNFTGVNVVGSFYSGLSWTQSGSVWRSSNTTAGQSLEFNATNGQLVIVPEPGAFAIAGIGMAFIGWSAWRSRRATQPRPVS